MLRIFIIFLVLNSLSFSRTYLSEIDSLKKIIKTADPTKMDYHNANLELFRRYRFNNRDSAKYFIDNGFKVAKKYNFEGALKDYHNVQGLYYFDEGNFSDALEQFYKCMQISVNLKEYGAVGYSYNDIGYVFYVQGLWDLALQHYREGLEGMKIQDSSKLSPIPYLFQNIGLSYGHLGQIDSSKKYFDLTIKFAERNNDSVRINHTLMYLANIYSRYNINRIKADSLYREVLNYFSRDKSWIEGYPYTLYYMAINFQEMDQLDSAEKYFILANNELFDLGWEKKTIDINYALAILFLKNNKFQKSEYYINLNDSLINKFDSHDLKADQYYYKYLFFEKKNVIDSAFYYLKEYSDTKDSMLYSSVTGKVSTVSKNMQILKNKQEKQIMMEKNVQRIYLLLFIIIMTVFLIILFYSRLRIQKKNIVIINEKNEALEKANLLLDDANKTKDKFFSIIAHDLKNPIGAIKSTSEILNNEYDLFESTDIKESIEDIYKSSVSVLNLLESLLSWSRSQRGIIDFTPENFHLILLINNIFQLFKNSVVNKNIKLTKNIDEDFLIYADSNMLNTIIRNLVSNSIKFTPENGEINITAIKEENNSIIIISDTGVGISKENQEKLFNFGTNITTPGTNNEKGTGLGLILVYEFVQKHDGKIEIESEVGKGTKFIITLPNAK